MSRALAAATSTATLARLEELTGIPEEALWLASHRSRSTREAYRADVAAFMRFLEIRTSDELRQVGRAAVLAWVAHLEERGAKPTTVRRRLAALSSLFAHLVHHQVLPVNPCREIQRPAVNRREGSTPAFSAAQGRALLDAPDPRTLIGLRDRAILSVGLQAGARRAEIVGLRVRDFHQDRGFDGLSLRRKGGGTHRLAVHSETGARIREYLAAAGHADNLDGPLFRDTRPRSRSGEARRLHPKEIDRILRRAMAASRILGRYSPHSMRATFITTALANGASLEDVQAAAGHADPDTTKLYDRRRYSPERSAAFFANY